VLGTRFASRLSFQARLTLVAAAAVAIAVIAATASIYAVVSKVLWDEVNNSLVRRVDGAAIQGVGEVRPLNGQVYVIQTHWWVVLPPDQDGGTGYGQVVRPDGSVSLPLDPAVQAADASAVHLPITEQDRTVAAGGAPPSFRTDRVDGAPVRVYTAGFADPRTGTFAIEVARPIGETYRILNLLRDFLIAVCVAGIVLGALLGRLIAQAALGPIGRLRAAVDHVTETRDMSRRVPDEGTDELGRLGTHFNRMLEALDQSLRTQRQLVGDASHELRTPLASLRTNIEVLQRSPNLAEPDRGRLLRDVVAQVEQLTRLIGDLIDLARGDQQPEELEEVRLDWIVAAAVERAAINWPAVRFQSNLAESVVVGQAGRLDRAISNLLDNAGKWSPAGGVVNVSVTDHEVVVRDHGPGIEPTDLPYVFDRFWRAPAARSMPGSGLGLSIVRQVADSHGATVSAELPQDGGTLMRLKFADSKPALSHP
jgi:two-component system, OmpR family, sensor histidine kinase MprB